MFVYRHLFTQCVNEESHRREHEQMNNTSVLWRIISIQMTNSCIKKKERVMMT